MRVLSTAHLLLMSQVVVCSVVYRLIEPLVRYVILIIHRRCALIVRGVTRLRNMFLLACAEVRLVFLLCHDDSLRESRC